MYCWKKNQASKVAGALGPARWATQIPTFRVRTELTASWVLLQRSSEHVLVLPSLCADAPGSVKLQLRAEVDRCQDRGFQAKQGRSLGAHSL